MMKKYLPFAVVLILAGCGAAKDGPKVSRLNAGGLTGMTYNEFRARELTHGSDGSDTQKRFLALDRNGDGRLSANEMGNF